MEKDVKAILETMIVVLLTIAIYNTLFKRYTPTAVQNFIGL